MLLSKLLLKRPLQLRPLCQASSCSFSGAFKPTAAQVKDLRNLTGSPLKDCMAVLVETGGDISASKDLLRKKGLAFADKRADRDATEGLIGLLETTSDSQNTVTMVQFACETDFVAKTDRFRDGLQAILKTVHGQDGLAVGVPQSRESEYLTNLAKRTALLESLDEDVATQTIEEGIKYTISKTQENCQLAGVYKSSWEPSQGEVLSTYLHNRVMPGVGKIGAAFLLGSGDASLNSEVQGIAQNLAMHAAAMKPSYTQVDELPEDVIAQAIEEAKDLALQNAKEGMPEKARENMLKGIAKKAVSKLQKSEVLMEQELATSDENLTVAAYLDAESARLGKPVNVKEWVLFMIR